jgi:hypothetical protein
MACHAGVMSTRCITLRVAEEQALCRRDPAGDSSFPAWVTGASEAELENVEAERVWREFYASVAPSRAEVRRGDTLYQRLTRPSRRG